MSDPRYELLRTPFDQLVDDVKCYIDKAGVNKHMLRDVVPSLREARERAKIGHFDRNEMPVIDPSDFDAINAVLDSHGIPDSVNFSSVTLNPLKLIPLQRQLHVDKVIDSVKREGRLARRHIQMNPLVITEDFHILDGHHSWLCSIMLANKMYVSVFVIDAPTDKVLPILLDWSDKHHPRNT